MALTDDVKQQIQQAYRDVLAGKDVRARYGQRLMIAEIARYMGEITDNDGQRTSPPAACVVEAGTGTGKTLAYLIAAIPVAKALGKTLVISTATVALQDQIVLKDLPDLRKHSKLDFSWTLAKGRGRYLCMSRLESRLHDEGHGDSDTMPLFLLDQPMDDEAASRITFEKMLATYGSREWDGDRDHWPEQIPDDIWRQVTTDHRQCTNRHCAYFDSCAFFDARKDLDDADVVVANHDLVLADLALGGGAILPEPENALFIFDEAHHLPDKALNHFAASVPLNSTRQWLKQLSQALVKMQPWLPGGSQAAKAVEKISTSGRDLDLALGKVYEEVEQNTGWEFNDERRSAQWRYPDGELPEAVAELAADTRIVTAGLVRHLGTLVDELQSAFDERKDPELDRDTADSWYPVIGAFHSRAEEQLRLWAAWCESGTVMPQNDESTEAAPVVRRGPPPARWAVRQRWDHAEDITLFSSPVLADNLLYSRLWSRVYGAVLTSATLTALGRFDRLRSRAGLPEASRYLVVPSSFRYGEMATVEVPAMAAMPTDDGFAEALIKRLPDLWAGEKATLVLFTSRRQMQQVRDALAPDYPELILTQDDMAKNEVLKTHCSRVDEGRPSVLFGVASFAEGIDLPGKYLHHVVITRLPFSVPDDPIEASLAEWVTQRGGNPFMEITVPDASVKLVQAVGRLLRTEQDTGRVTILDRRIVARRYGQLLLDALPPFRRIIEH
ncbi:MAG: ATP-dependent DNA helicase DinG [Marinobacter sp.]|uniref:ATP-dependent DNA helicase DinG n=1 Tax=Marinobacter sp. TaxID=50741 RepID=UPI0029C47565|nr:ATP-dependent DNA helicase DinG [Marinobacter sp.]MDX5336416.1 ATP-dependent DNA helicase DinG [Marinobacter sp.]MDX5387492.1 ATP-dependent DNA helicase DinG [Marinobacter sp.]MDX5441840.1 ATP-dependent DNA helicase DinG [Alteromonadaceae bacterium]MDX5472858.1 ATP-dependent DNA helicase DinG [Marinobacter sp.]